MSNNIYFGKSTTNSATSAKEVGLITAPTDRFNEGDLLAVYFESHNTASNPTIVFTPISVADDEGRFIKTQDVDVDSSVWNDGEVVLFCLVYDTTSSDEPGYWEAIGKIHASGENCGITKLDGIALNDSVENWLNNEIIANDYNTAINVATVKAMMQSLMPPKEDEEEVAEVVYGLQWKQNDNLGEQWTSIGNLSLSNTSAGVSIGIPTDLLNRQNIIFTGQLVNNGMDGTNDPQNPDPELPLIEPFLTRYIPNDLFFVPGGTETTPSQDLEGSEEPEGSENSSSETPAVITYLSGNGIALQGADLSRSIENNGVLEPRTEDTLPYHVRFDNDKLVLGFNNSDVFKKVIIRPNLEVDGPAVIKNDLQCDGTINGNDINGTNISASWLIKENNSYLKNRYSGRLKVIEKISSGQTISPGKFQRFRIPWTLDPGWRPIGVVGYNIDSMTTAAREDLYWANVVECFLVNTGELRADIDGTMTVIKPETDHQASGSGDNDIEVAIYNLNTSKSIYVRIQVYVLCEYVNLTKVKE